MFDVSFDVTTALLCGALVFLGYTIYGLTGFGASIVAIPLLAQVISLKTAVPLMLLMDLVAGAFMGVRNQRDVARNELKIMFAWMVVGMAVGVTLLVKAPENWLLILLGLFALTQSARNLIFKPRTDPISALWGGIYGTVGGVFTSLFGTGGPIYAIYLARRVHEESRRRATLAMLIWISSFARLILFLAAGLLLSNELWMLALVTVAFSLAGIWTGSHIRKKLSHVHLNQVMWLVVGLAGLLLLARNVPSLMD